LISPSKNNNPLKVITTVALILGIISYATGTVPLALAFELSAPNKNLQVQWWKWILGIPPDESPATDKTGEFCDQDQKGPIWYLAGIAGSSEGLPGGSATRNCNVPIPEGKDILIPIFNTVCAEITDAELIKGLLGLQPDDEIPPSQLKEGLVRCTNFFLDHIVEQRFSIDGQTLQGDDLDEFRVLSPQFQVVYPDGNVFEQSPTNVKQKAVAEGIWVLIKDLEPGEYEIKAFSHLRFPEFDPVFEFQTDVTYHLTIEGKNTFPSSNEDNNPVLSKLMGNPVQASPSVGASAMDKLMLN
jgi:hypothetical protein